jgi:hypothetical protein
MTTRQDLLKNWAPILEHESLNPIKDNYRKEVTAVLLENTERELAKSAQALFEDAPSNSGGAGLALGGAGALTGGVAGYDPVLISLVRRAAPQLIAYDICGVQPMTQPTGLIFAMKARYGAQSGTEALFNEADTEYTGANNALFDGDGSADTNPQSLADPTTSGLNTGRGMTTSSAEGLGSSNGGTFQEMAFSIERTSVTAQTRALKAEYSVELAQDLKSVHGLDAENELSNILSTEILAEINREVVRTL